MRRTLPKSGGDLGAQVTRTDEATQQLEIEIGRQRVAISEAQSRLDRLYDAIEAGVAELHDPRFKARVDLAKLQIREGTGALDSCATAARLAPSYPRLR